MKLEQEVIGDKLIIETEEPEMSIAIHIPTGEVEAVEYLDVSIHRLTSFINKAKTKYNRFLNSKDIDDFIR